MNTYLKSPHSNKLVKKISEHHEYLLKKSTFQQISIKISEHH